MCLLPKRTPEGYHITFYKLMDTDPAKYDCQDYYKRMDMLGSVWGALITTSPGVVVIVDSAGASMGHFTRMDLSIVKKYTLFLQVRLVVTYIISYIVKV